MACHHVTLTGPGGSASPPTLTTEHAASCYGQPVAVLTDGTALGPGAALRLELTRATCAARGAHRDAPRTPTARLHRLWNEAVQRAAQLSSTPPRPSGPGVTTSR